MLGPPLTGTTSVAGCGEVYGRQSIDILLPLDDKNEVLGGDRLKEIRQPIRDLRDAVEVPDPPAFPVGSALPEIFGHIANGLEEQRAGLVHIVISRGYVSASVAASVGVPVAPPRRPETLFAEPIEHRLLLILAAGVAMDQDLPVLLGNAEARFAVVVVGTMRLPMISLAFAPKSLCQFLGGGKGPIVDGCTQNSLYVPCQLIAFFGASEGIPALARGFRGRNTGREVRGDERISDSQPNVITEPGEILLRPSRSHGAVSLRLRAPYAAVSLFSVLRNFGTGAIDSGGQRRAIGGHFVRPPLLRCASFALSASHRRLR